MAESTETQVQPTTPAAQESPDAPKVDEVQAKIDAALSSYKAELDKKQSEIRGLDKKIGELSKALQAKDLEKMSDAEKLKFEIEQAKAEADKERQTALSLKKQNVVVSQGLAPEFANLINGTTDDEILESLKTVTAHIEAEVAKRAEKIKNEFYGGQSPKSGQAPNPTSLQSALDDAKKAGNTALATAIRRKANADGVTLQG